MSYSVPLVVSSRKEIAVSALLIASLLVTNPINPTNAASSDDGPSQSVVAALEPATAPHVTEDIDAGPIVSRKVADEQLESSDTQLIQVTALPSHSFTSEFDRDGSTIDSREAMPSPIIGEEVDAHMIELQCIDSYLWTLYQRTPKEDSIRVRSHRKVTIKKNGKSVSVTRTVSRSVSENFSWKDPKSAELFGKSLPDYVIGGMETAFKVRLAKLLRAAELTGYLPGITSAFRDDYRQSIASGLKAATNRSYHGGSMRGGYGHGLAADVVSVNGDTRSQRMESTRSFWKWIDAHGIEFGIGRPYLDRDAPHVGPTDGKEFADHRPALPNQEQPSASKLAAKTGKGIKIASKDVKL